MPNNKLKLMIIPPNPLSFNFIGPFMNNEVAAHPCNIANTAVHMIIILSYGNHLLGTPINTNIIINILNVVLAISLFLPRINIGNMVRFLPNTSKTLNTSTTTID